MTVSTSDATGGATVAVSLPSRVDAPAAARRALAQLEGAVGHADLARVRLVVTELVANSVKHAHGDAIRVQVSAVQGLVRGEVADEGVGFVPPEGDRAQPMRGVGWGLLLVRRMTDRWGVAADRSTVWFEIDLDRPPRS